jgi:hypothetical protein
MSYSEGMEYYCDGNTVVVCVMGFPTSRTTCKSPEVCIHDFAGSRCAVP